MALATVLAAQLSHHATKGSISPMALGVAGLIVGFSVGLTGMGGGALMTPILVLLFRVTPSTAVSSDLLASLLMKPVGAGVHLKNRSVNWVVVGWLCLGSMPAAFAGVFVLRVLGSGHELEARIRLLLGWALLVSVVAMVTKATLQARMVKRLRESGEEPNERPHVVKPGATVLIGAVGGLVVGMTSVGSGSLMIVLLMLLYPRLKTRTMVGTDLVQAIPLVGAATLGHAFFGHVSLSVTGALLVGCLPGVFIGARVSSRASDGLVRPALVVVLLTSGLGLLGMRTASVGLLAITGFALWGAVDATTLRNAQWVRAGRSRTLWVALQGIGAPFGIGFLASLAYFAKIRTDVVRAGASPQLAPVGLREACP